MILNNVLFINVTTVNDGYGIELYER